MKLDFQSQVLDPELWNALKAKYKKSSAATDSCRIDAFRKRDHDDHQGDDAPLEGEKNAKRIEATIKDILSNQFRDVEEYTYHLEQAHDYMENQIRNPNEPPRYLYNKDLFTLNNGNTEEKTYALSLYKIHATLFPEEDLEEN
ncbi:hypothetical protein Tco_1089926 [Tanacetum coccineum]|uniref:Uncharacterized protein n=1 Tax=Tanacetum coccineum TaxID=301880 RepID=A0ABQ5I2X2_9ASTR